MLSFLTPLFRRTVILAIGGALAGVICLFVRFTARPAVVFEMDRDFPGLFSGLYEVERAGDITFAWTSRSAALRLRRLDRHVPWSCDVRIRGGRSVGTPQPSVDVAIDGLTAVTRTVTNEYETVALAVPAQRARSGLTLTLTSSSVIIPGPSDPRQLGVQIDRVACRPAAAGARPPVGALMASAVSGALFGAAFAVVGATPVLGAAAVALLAVMQAVALCVTPALYSGFVTSVPWLAFWIALPAALAGTTLRRSGGWSAAASCALGFSGAALFLELLALLHPAKPIVDALFHAHRFDAVLAGRYFFTQQMPSGVQFPYAIALYVFAAPWARLTGDHVALLRVIVSTLHVLAGLSLYPLVVRHSGDRLAAVLAVVIYQVMPLPFVVIGNANLTYAFGQSVAVVTIAAASVFRLQARDFLQVGALFLLSATAFLSHVGVFPLLFTTLTVAGCLGWWRGDGARRLASRTVLLIAIAAAVFSVAVYYARFGEAYSTLAQARAISSKVPTPAVVADGPVAEAIASASLPLHRRISRALGYGVADAGWAVLVLALIGVWGAFAEPGRSRLRVMLAAIGLTYVVFLAFSVSAPVEPQLQRYNDEFVWRLDFAVMPGLAALGAIGASLALRAGRVGRATAVALLALAVLGGIRSWLAWLM